MTIMRSTKLYYSLISYFILLSLLALVSCQKSKTYTYLNGNALGTSFSIRYEGTRDYSQTVDSLFTVVNQSLSTYHQNSIISRINQGDFGVVIDDHFRRVFTKAKRIYHETNGLFDPTVGPLVNAYGFGPKKTLQNIDSSAISKLMPLIGFDKVNLKGNSVYKKNPKMFIDFNAIAKGYAIDVIGHFLESKNIANYMVEVGGEIRARGVNDKGELWKIGIEKPLTDGTRALETTVNLYNQAMATSGNYRKFKVDEKGRKFVHTINPKTGQTAQNDLLSATVISSMDCADVDGYATSFMVMGLAKTKQFLAQHAELKVFLIYVDEVGDTQVYSTL